MVPNEFPLVGKDIVVDLTTQLALHDPKHARANAHYNFARIAREDTANYADTLVQELCSVDTTVTSSVLLPSAEFDEQFLIIRELATKTGLHYLGKLGLGDFTSRHRYYTRKRFPSPTGERVDAIGFIELGWSDDYARRLIAARNVGYLVKSSIST